MAYSTIDDPSAFFQTTLYTGNGGTQSITNTGNSDLQPDFVWVKERNGATKHYLFDSVRGVHKSLHSHSADDELDNSNTLTAFNSDGFSIGNLGEMNTSSDTYVAWQWKAGTSFTNDASSTSIGATDSTGSVNDTAGFSIVSYTGVGGTSTTIKHGLSTAPRMMIIGNRSANSVDWAVYHESIANTHRLYLNLTDAKTDSIGTFRDTSPTTAIFTVGDHASVNTDGATYIAYCFAEKQGYSKFGSFVGSSANTFVYLGFKPKFFLWKNTSQGHSTFDHWGMVDTARQTPSGNTDGYLRANASNAESDFSGNGLFFLSNGIKFVNTGRYNDNDGDTYIFMAFAENPFVTSTGVPATAG